VTTNAAPYPVPTPTNAKEIAFMIDHTLLKPESTHDQVAATIEDGVKFGAFSICISPTFTAFAKETAGDRIKICTVVGFPSGKVVSSIKAAEAAQAVADGADEVDMVIDFGMAKEGKFDLVQADIQAVRDAIPGTLLKVIIESAALTDDEIVAACQASEAAGADSVKTSTGFHPTGGSTPHAVKIMSDTVAPRLGVKASGGVRDLAGALAVIEAGATRLGMSATAAVIAGFEDESAKADSDY
jgi:deoxyribose-phosphate aldolase